MLLPTRSQATLTDTIGRFYRKEAPWWRDISTDIKLELEIPANTQPQSIVDVVIIGGGVAGLSAALAARSLGAQVLVLEKETTLGYGATGRNAGILSAGINMGMADLAPESPARAFWPETTRELLALVAEAALPRSLLSARLTGSISLAETEADASQLAREALARQNAGLRAEMWTPAQVAEVTQGRLDGQTVVSALWLPDEGRIQPLTLLAHLAKRARASGVLISGQAQVINYRKTMQGSRSHGWQLELADGSLIQARGLICAVGPTERPDARIYALAFAANFPDTFPLFWDATSYTYADYRPGNGRLNVSGGRYGKAGVTCHDARYFQHLADETRRWLPELASKEPQFTWAVDIHVTADMVPTLRTLGHVSSGVAVEGLGALGVLPGIVLGQHAAKRVVGAL
jgi:glycine/D-amino acid oxidase-like deaminating enzyme